MIKLCWWLNDKKILGLSTFPCVSKCIPTHMHMYRHKYRYNASYIRKMFFWIFREGKQNKDIYMIFKNFFRSSDNNLICLEYALAPFHPNLHSSSTEPF